MKKSDPPLVAGGGFGCHRKFKLTVIVLLLFGLGISLIWLMLFVRFHCFFKELYHVRVPVVVVYAWEVLMS